MNNFVENVERVFTIKIPRLPNSKKFILVVMKQMILYRLQERLSRMLKIDTPNPVDQISKNPYF